jgi:hypothetical protein
VGGTYRTDGRATSWLKVKNLDYTQVVDRHELFADRQRHEGRSRSMANRVDLVQRRLACACLQPRNRAEASACDNDRAAGPHALRACRDGGSASADDGV